MKIKSIQDILNTLRNKVHIDGYIKFLGNKTITYETIKDDIDILILGSSHAQFSYRAKDNAFNFGASSQDLYYSYKLYEKYNKNLKTIILFYSVFSPGNQTIKTNYANVAVKYKIITEIDYQDTLTAKEKNLYELEDQFKKEYVLYKQKHRCNTKDRGNQKHYQSQINDISVAERAYKHLKNNLRDNHQTDYVIKMKDLANCNNARFLVVIPPATSTYKNCLPSFDKLFKELLNASNQKDIEILNLYDSPLFLDSDFVDCDHLNLKGAKKLTKIVNEYLKQ